MKFSLSFLLIILSTAFALGQKTASDEIERGHQFKKAGNNAAAIEAYSRAIEADPASASAYLERGELLGKTQRCGDALSDLTKALEIDRNLYRALVGRAFCLGSTGNTAASIADSARAIELDASKPAAYYTRGMGLYAARKTHEALRDFNQAIELGMNTAEVYAMRAAARDATDDWLGAVIDHKRAVDLEPGNWKRYAGRALARRSLGDYLASVADYDKALELAPNERREIFNRSWAKLFNNDSAGAYQDTLDYLGGEGADNPVAPFSAVVGYIALRRMGKSEAANALIQGVLKHKVSETDANMLRFLAGELAPEKLLERAKNDEWLLTDAHGLIGTKFLLDGDRANATVHFQWDQENGSHARILHQLARTEYARMTGDTRLLTPPLPRKRQS